MPTYGNNLFKGAAGYYAAYRPVYPSTLIRTLVDEFSLDGEGNILDLGCGPGTMTVRLADWAERTVGIDTEPEMIEEAERIHSMIRNGQVEWFAGTWAEYKMTNPHRFKLVTIAKAFHWMDRDSILEDLYDRVEAEGGIAIIDNYEPDRKLEPWQEVLDAIIRKWYGQERRAGDSTYTHPVERHETIIRRSRFTYEEITLPPYTIHWTIESILGNLYSTSYGAKRFLGDNIIPFEQEVKLALEGLAPFTEPATLSMKIARK
ncbi:class I SAM-dependent methyltransferase [Rossellomorea marisflavi]|uniref:Methyltransferase n=1 Tax=Rossellomorea marisflavi TaxID=189381 RepID=A0A161T4P2_9BACI|nr:class I SAM-dependent methyltransferase [Rossellomorea marisflavi]KZE44490.1 methyltransferase [Rossellomorea marisflavi]